MLMINKGGGASPGFIDTTKTNPILDPGIKTLKNPHSNNKEKFVTSEAWLPDTIDGVVIGFQQLDGVVKIQSATKAADGKMAYEDKMIIVYDHNNNILKAYEVQQTPRGPSYVEVGEKGVYSFLGVSSGITKSSLKFVLDFAENVFHPTSPRAAAYAAYNIMRDISESKVGYDAMMSAVKGMFKAFNKNPIKTPELIEVFQEIYKNKLYAKDGNGYDIFYIAKDYDGLYSKMIQLYADELKKNDKLDTLTEELFGSAKISEKNNPKMMLDMKEIIKRIESADTESSLIGMPVIIAQAARTNNEGEEKQTYLSDEELSSNIQAIFNGLSIPLKEVCLASLDKEASKRSQSPAGSTFIREIKDAIVSENATLDKFPFRTDREKTFITRDNAEAVCKKIQEIYDMAGYEDKTRFSSEIKDACEDIEDAKFKADVLNIVSRVEAEKTSDRLNMVPILGKHLILKPTPDFFSYISEIRKHKNTAEDPNTEDSVKDKYGIVRSMMDSSLLSETNTTVLSAVGGLMSVYSPALDTVVVHDSRLVPTKNTYDAYQTFSKNSYFKIVEKIFRDLKNNITPSVLQLKNAGMKDEEAERIAKLPLSDQKEAMVRYVVYLNQNYANGKKTSPRPLIGKRLLGEFITKPFDEKVSMSNFWGSLIHKERAVLCPSPKELQQIKLVEEDGNRPRFNSGAGLPADLAMFMSPIGSRGFRRIKKDHMAAVSFTKRVDIKKRDFGDGVEIEIDGGYKVSKIVTPKRTQYFLSSGSLPEQLSRHIHGLEKCDLSGRYTYENASGGTEEGHINVAKALQGIIDTLVRFAQLKLGKGRKEAVQTMLSEMSSVMSSENRVAKAKDVLFENPSQWTKEIVTAALIVNPNKIYRTTTDSQLAKDAQEEVNLSTERLFAAHLSGDWSNSRYIKIDNAVEIGKKVGMDEQQVKTRLSKIQYDINGLIDIGLHAIATLEKRGEEVIARGEKTTTAKDNTHMAAIDFAPEVVESKDILTLIRDQWNTEVRANKFSSVRSNDQDPYITFYKTKPEERQGVDDYYRITVGEDLKQTTEKRNGDFLNAIKELSTDQLLKEAMDKNSSGNKTSYGAMLTALLLSEESVSDQTLPNADDVVEIIREAAANMPSADPADPMPSLANSDEIDPDFSVEDTPIGVEEFNFTEFNFEDEAFAQTIIPDEDLSSFFISGETSYFQLAEDGSDIGYEDDSENIFKYKH